MGILSTIKERKAALFFFFLLLALGYGVAHYLINQELHQLRWEVVATKGGYPLVQEMRLIFIGLGCALPALGALLFIFAKTLDRFIALHFLSSLFLTTSIMFLIWLLGDFSENVSDITGMDSPLKGMVLFYANQIPMVLSLILPYCVLFATLWTLSTLSRHCEITPILQTGRSLIRLCLPLILIAFCATIYTTIFNYHWGPSATMYRKMTFNLLDRERAQKQGKNPSEIIFKNDNDNRIWRIKHYPDIQHPTSPFREVQIEQFSLNGKLDKEYMAQEALWEPSSRQWVLKNVLIRHHPQDNDGIPFFEEQNHEQLLLDFRETPWLLVTPSLKTDTRGVPDLVTRLDEDRMNDKMRREFRTHKYLRFAQGASCLILALLAIPNGISFSRRGSFSGIGLAIGLSAFMIFSFEVCSSLASAGYLLPWLGALLPDFLFLFIALYLFYTKLAQRKISELFFWKKRSTHAPTPPTSY